MEGEIFSLARKCTRIRLTESVIAAEFSCGKAEIDDFFHKEHLDYEREMLARTYVFLSDDDPAKIVAAKPVIVSAVQENIGQYHRPFNLRIPVLLTG